jgi:deoxyribonuclease-1
MKLLFAALLFLPALTGADQFMIPNARESEQLFWSNLYPGHSWTLYCGEYFESRNKVGIEHIYSLTWAAAALNCGDLEQCRHNSARFNRVEADLHNQYPAKPLIIQVRKDYRFGLIPDEFREFFECDFEISRRDQIAEPRAVARGNVARALFYMHSQYELPINADMLTLLKDWNLADSPSKDEIRRNDIIEKLQGTRNLFIDNPQLADQLSPNATTTTAQRNADIQLLESFY